MAITFEQPWVAKWLRDSFHRFALEGSLLVFADNSRSEEARREIKALANEGTIYLPLPKNPWRHFNRSHGSAMIWIFDRLQAAGLKTERFSFIDHDLIPVAPIRIKEELQSQPYYGLLNLGFDEVCYSLWAGFCHYDWKAVAEKKLNFLTDVPRRLDTGGRNWGRLYQQFPREEIRFADQRIATYRDEHGEAHLLEALDDCWIHLGRVGHHTSRLEERRAFYRFLEAELKAGAKLSDFELPATSTG